jgi:two-component system chemotaxis sensor kinase CheA
VIIIDIKQYLGVFIEESREHLDSLNKNLLDLEKQPDDIQIIDEIFRSAHTLKGMAGTMGFEKVSILTHEMENILTFIRNGQINATTQIIDLLLESLDTLETLITSISDKSTESDIDVNNLIDKIRNVNAIDDKAFRHKETQKSFCLNEFENRIITEAKNRNLNTYEIKIVLNTDCLLKSARAFLIFRNLEKHGEIIKTIPSVEEIEDGEFDDILMYLITNSEHSAVLKEVQDILEIETVKVTPIDYKKAREQSVAAVGTVEIQENVNPLKAKNKNTLKRKIGKTVRVDINRLDNLMNLVSELIIIKTRLEGMEGSVDNKTPDLFEAIEYLERITTSLHDAVMKVRMVPIEQVFNRFPRMIRDLSKELKKKVIFNIEGQDTELDRTVIDEIGDPLIHILRNAVDHGLELPEEREKAGKPVEGIITLKAYHDGNNVVIEIQDDGRGIDLKRVAEKAVTMGLISQDIARMMKKDELVELLFKPGFSTAKQVTDVSGRGVGMDVVKTKIESLGGNVEVKTTEGEGTCFQIRLPLTLAIIQALMVEVGSEKYAIPLSTIKETVMIEKEKISTLHKNEVMLFRGSVLPLLRLHKPLGIEKDNIDDKEVTVVIVKKGEKLTGLIVDALIGQQEIVIKSLGKFLNNIRIIAGATILGDGRVALILDTNALS